MSSVHTCRVAAIRLLVLIIALTLMAACSKSGNGELPPVDCQISQGACLSYAGDMLVAFNVIPRPVKAMRELNFGVVLEGGAEFESLTIYLTMPGMEMGNNWVQLTPLGDGKYMGRGVIPRCPSGQRLWRAVVEDPSGRSIASYHFEVE